MCGPSKCSHRSCVLSAKCSYLREQWSCNRGLRTQVLYNIHLSLVYSKIRQQQQGVIFIEEGSSKKQANNYMISVNTVQAERSAKKIKKLLKFLIRHRLLQTPSDFLFHLSSRVRQSLKNGINGSDQYLAQYCERSYIIVS